MRTMTDMNLHKLWWNLLFKFVCFFSVWVGCVGWNGAQYVRCTHVFFCMNFAFLNCVCPSPIKMQFCRDATSLTGCLRLKCSVAFRIFLINSLKLCMAHFLAHTFAATAPVPCSQLKLDFDFINAMKHVHNHLSRMHTIACLALSEIKPSRHIYSRIKRCTWL